jgi:methoxymalonate biosynthesis acyl carrier protein
MAHGGGMGMVQELHKKSIREFFSLFFFTGKLGDGDDIFSGGYVNSLFAMQLIAWLEKEFDVVVADSDLQIGNFNSVSSVAAFIERKTTKTHGEVAAR